MFMALFDRGGTAPQCLQAAARDSAQQNHILLRYGVHKMHKARDAINKYGSIKQD